MKNYPVSRKDNLVVQEMDGEVLIYDLAENKAYCLNETSALIWQACDGNKSTAEISEFISQELNSPANEDLIWLAIDQLKKEKLIENGDEIPNNFAGMSRREVIKKVGLGTMIALPIVASMVAPSAVSAASLVACNPAAVCACQNSSNPVGAQCTTGGSGSPCTPASSGCNCYSLDGTMTGVCRRLA
jgi:hypothetical protein